MTIRHWIDLVEGNEEDHFDALERTGFYGARGSGCLIMANDTKRFLLMHRSEDVEQPGFYGICGGAIDSGEDPLESAKREVVEEAGFHGHALAVEPLYVFKKGTFRYYNFLMVIEHEFVPVLNWESQGYIWAEWNNFPEPLHFGVIALLADPTSIQKIEAAINS